LARPHEKPDDVLEYIDATADVQSEPAGTPVDAGVADYRLLANLGGARMPVNLSILTSTGLHRGVHMSRLVKAAGEMNGTGVERWLRKICAEVNRTQPGSTVTATFELPYEDQFADVTAKATERGAITYRVSFAGMTACPCSKKMTGIGHMQRAQLTVVLRRGAPVDLIQVVRRIGGCFSALPTEHMKRLQEAKKIIEAQTNPKFAEDLVRDCVARFPDALYISGRCFESIHAHDAVATWSSKPGWMPSF
jgi:GTP cyclohydrolase FolE2